MVQKKVALEGIASVLEASTCLGGALPGGALDFETEYTWAYKAT